MNKYLFNSRDIAAYLKWFNVPNYQEIAYMNYFFALGDKILAEPLTRDFEAFKSEVYRELYYLWANGFENDHSDISRMASKGSLALICEQDCINLESYMKLITLHLIFSGLLPYVKLSFWGLAYSLGIKCDFRDYERNVAMAIEGLNLCCKDVFGKPFDITKGLPDELLCISLTDDFKITVHNDIDLRYILRDKEKKHMEELKKNSLKNRDSGKKEIKKVLPSDASDNTRDSKTSRINTKQPKGAPLNDRNEDEK